MPNFISEDDIEVAMVPRLKHLYGDDSLNGFTSDPADLNDGSGRNDRRDVILHDRLKEAAFALNPGIPDSGLIEPTIPGKPTSRLQKYRLTAKGRRLVAQLDKERNRLI